MVFSVLQKHSDQAEEPALELARLLRDQGGQIAEIDKEIHSLNFRAEGTVACRRMLPEMQQFIHLFHRLRGEPLARQDRLQDGQTQWCDDLAAGEYAGAAFAALT